MEYEEKFQMLYLKKNVFFYSLMKDATTLRELLLLKLCPNLCPPTVCQWLLNSPKRYLSWFYTWTEKVLIFCVILYAMIWSFFLSFILFIILERPEDLWRWSEESHSAFRQEDWQRLWHQIEWLQRSSQRL